MYGIDHSASSPQQIRESLQLAALREHLPDQEIRELLWEMGHRWRERELPPWVMVQSMVFRAMHADHSIANMLVDLAAHSGGEAPSDAAWCQARHRLPLELLDKLIHRGR